MTVPTGRTLPELLGDWMVRQRWYADKGRAQPRLDRLGGLLLREAQPATESGTESGTGAEVGVEVFFVAATTPVPGAPDGAAGTDGVDGGAGGHVVTYQVPLTYRPEPEPTLAHALIGVVEDPSRGRQWIYDAPHDPRFVEAWLDLLTSGDQATAAEGARYGAGYGVRYGDGGPVTPGPARVLIGEQSNTSIIIGAANTLSAVELPSDDATPGDGSEGDRPPAPVIVKIFRVLHGGPNPDVSVQTVLAAAGCERVPRPAGSWEATWTGPDGEPLTGHLGYASEFVDGAQDAWRIACLAVEQDTSFEAEAYGLGEATAEVHAALAGALPTIPVDRGRLGVMADALVTRVEWATAASGGLLEEYRARALAVAASVRDVGTAPSLQHVHGDLHLGQVLNSPTRGWLLLDFEGEPLRPLAERTAPDLALRDVAGLLRSFDYAARHATLGLEVDDDRVAAAQRWAEEAGTAFLDGYAKAAGHDPREDAALLRALELDKALYEVVYEVRNRPEWVAVPLGAVERLLAEADEVTPPEATTQPQPASSVTHDVPTDGDVQPDGEEHTVSSNTGTSILHGASTVHLDEPDVLSGAHGPAIPQPVDPDVLAKVAGGAYFNPHAVLGAHPYEGAVTIRTLRPLASSVEVVLPGGSRLPMAHEWDGIWVAVVEESHVGDYRLAVAYDDVPEAVVDDPYRFLPTLGEIDLHLLREGRHEQLWQVLGAHVRRYPGVMGEVVGTSFAVWAPNAQAVRVVSDANQWIGRLHGMRSLGDSGVWELFVPGAGAGTKYKYEILAKDGQWRAKADPVAQAAEVPPSTASIVVESGYEWGDQDWIARRSTTSPHAAPMSIYEVHLGSWRQGLSYRDLADQLVGYVKDLGFTHVEFMPVMQHPFGGSWGYHVTGYYAVDSRHGSPDDFKYLVDRLHQEGIGVLLDWVPGHFATDEWALMRFDGEPVYEHPDPRKGWHPEWGSFIFDFGRTEVRNFLVANALFWLEEFHADGLRVDGVASMLYLDYSRKDGEWEPNQYGGRENLEAVGLLQETNATAYRRNPGVVVIAEESTAWPGVTRPTHLGGLGFGFKWNMGWMHDSLTYMSKEPVHRQYHHHQMTFSLMYAYSENFILPISHDEVVHGKGSLLRKMPGDRWQQLANVRAYLAFMWSHPGKQLLFMGAELGQEAEWAETRSLDWWLEETPWHAGLQQLVRDLNARYKEHAALWQLDTEPAGFEWIDANDATDNTFSYIRYGKASASAGEGRDTLVCVANFSGIPREGYRIGLPIAGRWREVLNTDAVAYAGSGVGNGGFVETEDVTWHGRPVSASLRVPPLGAVWLVPEPDEE